MSTRPDSTSASRLLRLFFAVSMRCTMSWSVPCVAMVVKIEPSMRGPDGVLVAEDAVDAGEDGMAVRQGVGAGVGAAGEVEAVVEDAQVVRLGQDAVRACPAADADPERDERVDAPRRPSRWPG